MIYICSQQGNSMSSHQKINTAESITLNPNNSATGSVIWLHGLGADGHDFVPIVPDLNLPDGLNLRFIFPHAPVMPVTVNQGFAMRAWFDIYAMDVEFKFDEEGVLKSVNLINELIEKEVASGIPYENIVLAGFSQGLSVALLTGVAHKHKLRGLMGLSGFLPDSQRVLEFIKNGNKEVPILLAHGTQDAVVPFLLGQKNAEMFKNAGYNVTWHEYPIEHSVSADEINDISKWLVDIYKTN